MSALLQSKSPKSQGYGAVEASPLATSQNAGPARASFFSKIFFSFVNPLFVIGNERQLNLDDIWELEGDDAAKAAFDKYNKHFVRHNGSVLKATVSAYGGWFLLSSLGSLFSAACDVFAPIVLNHVINAFTAPVIDFEDLYLWLGLFFASRVLNALVTANIGYLLEVMTVRLTVALKALIFRKAVRKSIHKPKSDTEAVDISNLYTSDVNNVLFAAYQVNSVWILPLQVGAVIYLLHAVIGLAAFAGLGIILLSMVASLFIASASRNAFKDIMKRKDERMKTIKEVFNAIQIIKFNAWEPKVERKIESQRAFELRAITRYLVVTSSSIFVLWASPIFVSIVSFSVYSLVLNETLTPAKVFTAIALFNSIRNPLRALPRSIQNLIQATVSLNRMSKFLEVEEYNSDNVTREDPSQPHDVVVAVENGSFGWSKDTPPILKNVSLKIKRGDLVVVHGSVGSGKSSLCSALLGEMEKLTGSVFVRAKSVAYYSQQAWIQNMSIRDNILFGNAFDERKYQRVLDSCGLLTDLAQLPAGDATEIGEKGVNLSGGQKARVSLARACYSDADLFILDSPLAAVDAVVQSEIFSKCICGLLQDKTVVLVTHSPDIIASKAANYKVLVENGELTGERKDATKPRSLYAPTVSPRKVKEAHENEASQLGRNDKASTGVGGRLVEDEDRQDGRVSKEVFMNYFRSVGGIKMCAILLVVQTLWQCSQVGSDLWLSHWTSQKAGAYNEAETEHNMGIYAALGMAAALMVLARTVTVSLLGLHASRSLFDSMTRSLLNAPLRFFDANPIGRIVNRYSDDMATIDFQLSFLFGSLSANLFFTVFQLATAVYMVSFLGVLIVPLVYIYISVSNFYLAPSREIGRLWKVVDSPVLSHVGETEEGITIIRAFGSQYVERALEENLRRISTVNRVELAMNAAQEWFQLRMQFIGCGVVILVVSSLVYLHEFLSPGLVGLAFSYALSIDSSIGNLVQMYSWLEISMVSPERIHEYANIPSEGSEKLLVVEPPAQWPQRGSIEFRDVVFSYKPDAPAVLKGLSFAIKSNEKVGIVGRTGAGKSSLTMALFRINELVSGRISIDGEDISSMPLRTLRSRMSIIPQSPVLFKGSLRAYMDPFDEFSDAEIWSAFEKVEIKEQVSALEGQLAFELSENGANFSVGERQMLCMARALLTQARIVVMDEATASIDHATEKKLQDMITRDFEDATVLTIAHRLATVLQSDRILVMSDGKAVEFDSPQTLAQNPQGVFYALAKEGGYLDQLL